MRRNIKNKKTKKKVLHGGSSRTEKIEKCRSEKEDSWKA